MKMDDKFEIELVSEQSRKLTHDEHTLRTHARHIHHVHLHVYVQQYSDVRARERSRHDGTYTVPLITTRGHIHARSNQHLHHKIIRRS